jgi:hypothetical protein
MSSFGRIDSFVRFGNFMWTHGCIRPRLQNGPRLGETDIWNDRNPVRGDDLAKIWFLV